MNRLAPNQGSSTLLRWTFRHGTATIVAQVNRRGSRYLLALTSGSSRSSLALETFDSAAAAFVRHAALAASLRAHGWSVVSYSAHTRSRSARAAA